MVKVCTASPTARGKIKPVVPISKLLPALGCHQRRMKNTVNAMSMRMMMTMKMTNLQLSAVAVVKASRVRIIEDGVCCNKNKT